MTLQSRIRAILLGAVAATLLAPSHFAAFAAEDEAETPQAEAESPAEETLEDLLTRLADPDEEEWGKVQEKVLNAWSRSGSDSMDLLLMRGREAMRQGDFATAYDHFSALIDHAPEFAEGWNARATLFYLMGEYGLSLADVERTLALEPKHFGALAGLGLILDELDRDEEALAAYRAALAVNPHMERIQQAAERLAPEVDGRGI